MILRKLLLVLFVFSVGPAAAVAAPVEIPLLQTMRGKVVVVDFWASWCEPCRHSFPWMSDLQKRYGPDGLVVIAINLDQDRHLAERFLAATPAEFRVEYDPKGGLGNALRCGVHALKFHYRSTGRGARES